MITGIWVSPDGQELAVQVDEEAIVLAEPYDGLEMVEVDRVEHDWVEVYRHG